MQNSISLDKYVYSTHTYLWQTVIITTLISMLHIEQECICIQLGTHCSFIDISS